jgi:hypothetical protein
LAGKKRLARVLQSGASNGIKRKNYLLEVAYMRIVDIFFPKDPCRAERVRSREYEDWHHRVHNRLNEHVLRLKDAEVLPQWMVDYTAADGTLDGRVRDVLHSRLITEPLKIVPEENGARVCSGLLIRGTDYRGESLELARLSFSKLNNFHAKQVGVSFKRWLDLLDYHAPWHYRKDDLNCIYGYFLQVGTVLRKGGENSLPVGELQSCYNSIYRSGANGGGVEGFVTLSASDRGGLYFVSI